MRNNLSRLALAAAMTVAIGANAAHADYATETCAALHKIKPATVNERIGVTCRWPGKTTYFECPTASGSLTKIVDAEAFDARCAEPLK